MIEFRFISKDKEKLAPLCNLICLGFCGWDEFVNNTVVVEDPISWENTKGGYYWSVSAYVGPNNSHDSAILVDIDNLNDESFSVYCKNAESMTDKFNCVRIEELK